MKQRSIMFVETTHGIMAVGFVGTMVGKVWLPGYSKAKLKKLVASWAPKAPLRHDKALLNKIQRYFDGKPVNFNQKIETSELTDFTQKVLGELCKIKWGEQITYGELAKRAGRAGAARAVGSVMANNDTPLIAPCHRVVRANGAIGEFSGPGGSKQKRGMLEMESGRE